MNAKELLRNAYTNFKKTKIKKVKKLDIDITLLESQIYAATRYSLYIDTKSYVKLKNMVLPDYLYNYKVLSSGKYMDNGCLIGYCSLCLKYKDKNKNKEFIIDDVYYEITVN